MTGFSRKQQVGMAILLLFVGLAVLAVMVLADFTFITVDQLSLKIEARYQELVAGADKPIAHYDHLELFRKAAARYGCRLSEWRHNLPCVQADVYFGDQEIAVVSKVICPCVRCSTIEVLYFYDPTWSSSYFYSGSDHHSASGGNLLAWEEKCLLRTCGHTPPWRGD